MDGTSFSSSTGLGASILATLQALFIFLKQHGDDSRRYFNVGNRVHRLTSDRRQFVFLCDGGQQIVFKKPKVPKSRDFAPNQCPLTKFLFLNNTQMSDERAFRNSPRHAQTRLSTIGAARRPESRNLTLQIRNPVAKAYDDAGMFQITVSLKAQPVRSLETVYMYVRQTANEIYSSTG